MQRREFLKTVGAASTGAVVMGGSALWAQNRETPTQSALIMDAMGEIRVTHTRTLLKQVINSGTNAVTVTLCDPKHQEDEARKVALAGLLDYDRHIKKNADLLIKATSVADMDQAKKEGKLALFYLFQNTTQFGRDLDQVDIFYGLGLRSCQLTYNYQNWAGAGCKERDGCRHHPLWLGSH